ncbi:MAG: M3 family metallopeptidase [Candidatus Cryptobacteroides sp.]
MKKKILMTMAAAVLLTGCHQNPFFSEWDTPYGIPPFGQIRNSDYMPAILKGIEQQNEEIDAIVSCADTPDFENTIAALDRSGALLSRVEGVLFNLAETDGTPELLGIVEEVIPLISDHSSNIFLNAGLFERVQKVYADASVAAEQGEGNSLSREQMMLLEKTWRAFVQNGVALDSLGQDRMRKINSELATLEQSFGTKLLAENNAFADEFGISVSEYAPTMGSCADRALRERMFNAYSSRGANGGDNDTRETLLRILELRQQKARLLGYDTPANCILSDKMARDSKTVDDFLQTIIKPAVAKAKAELKDLQKAMDKDVAAGLLPVGSTIQPWDWAYYTEKVRKEKFDLDEEQTRPYFKMENVRAGVFATASKLYGLEIEPVGDAPVYHPDVEVFRVSDAADGSLLGILTTDYYPRSTKRGGAWMNNVRDQYVDSDGTQVRPIIVNVGNFTKPTAENPSLLTIDEVGTMFHEFGHALHGLLTKCNYRSVSGTSVARDFVELPSQINENWAFQPQVLATYAFHYQTGEVIPSELVDKIVAAGNFNQGFMTTELAAASILDMKWHELESVWVKAGSLYASDTVCPEDETLRLIDIVKFEQKVCADMGLIGEIIPRYRTSYFNHIFNSGYSAGYYSYLWAEVLDKDAFELFKEKGIFDPETAAAFKHNILEAGGSEEPMVLYERFRGASPDSEALLRARGLR